MNTLSAALDRSAAATRPSALAYWLRRQVLRRFAGLQHGRLVVEDAAGRYEFGPEGAPLHCQVRIHDPEVWVALALRGSVGAGEAYMAGRWECDELVTLVRLLVLNRDLLDGLERGPARLGAAVLRGWHARRQNTLEGSRRNIAAHYDLGNSFFSIFLSPDLMYSSAIWGSRDEQLERASYRKLERICERLQLCGSDHVLEIGTGWGGFALHAARLYRCRVTTTTISREQYQLALERVRAARLEDRITVLLQDYRRLTGSYDKVVSIEMIEAVGAPFLRQYFAQMTKLLKPTGLALLQAITIEDHRYEQALTAVDFIKRHVFPGSFIPSIEAMLRAKTAVSDFALLHQEDFGLSYARTLAEWRARFLQRREEVRSQGLDESFIRMWDFYPRVLRGRVPRARHRRIAVAARPIRLPVSGTGTMGGPVTLWRTLVVIWLGAFFVMSSGWVWQQRHRSASIVDILWSAGLALSAVFCAAIAAGASTARVTVALMGGLWGARLAVHLWQRMATEGEDGRYRYLRSRWGNRGDRWFGMFQLQALLIAIFSIPFAIAAGNLAANPWLCGAAGVIWIISVAGELTADCQLARFRADPANRGITCRAGLWRYSRHPNYFFEWLHWFCYPVVAIGAPHAILAWTGPFLMLLFLRFLSGIPFTEAQALRTRGADYLEYQRSTSMLIPWPPAAHVDSRTQVR